MSASKLYKFVSSIRYLGIIFFFLCLLVIPVQGAEEKKTQDSSPAETEKMEKEKTLITFIKYASELSYRFVELKNEIDDTKSLSLYDEKFPKITQEIAILSPQIRTLKSDKNLNREQLQSFESQISNAEYRLKKISAPLVDFIDKLSGLINIWAAEKKELASWREKATHDESLKLIKKDIENSAKKVDEAVELIKQKLMPALAAGKKTGDAKTTLYKLHDDVENFLTKVDGIRLQKTSSSIFSAGFYAQLDKNLWQTTWQNITGFVALQKKLIVDHAKSLSFLIISTFFLAIIIRRSRKPIKGSAPWHAFTVRPVSAAFFVCLASFTLVEFFSDGIVLVPQGWETIKNLIIVSVSIPLIRVLVATSWARRIIVQFAFVILIITVFKLVNLPLPLMYIFLSLITLMGTFFYLWQSHQLTRKSETSFGVWSLRLGSFFLFSCLILIISGFGDFALYFLDSLLTTGASALACWIFFLVTCGTLDVLLLLSPGKIGSQNADAIIKSVAPVFIVFYGSIFLSTALQAWGIYPTREAAWDGLLSFSFAIGSWNINTDFVFTSVILIYCILLIARTVKFLLMNEVLPHYSMEKGTQISIVRLVNYSILILGFLLVAHMLGFNMTQLTVFGGALGIGIGFGLKEIVNNIASGLILLFERPIKIGDMVEVGEEIGEVKEIGLRATVVQTFDNAEIVIPNSDFIIGQVTNWTLEERKVRVKLAVGVSYGSDLEKVFSILLSCAQEHPMVLSEPQPRALFLAFGESSLDFELRVWIHDFIDRRVVQSELNNEIKNEFDMAGVEIPFPQRDLHLRSSSVNNIIDSPVAADPKPA